MNKVLGSSLIIAGTTIGAGMLALPLASAGIGFGASMALMGVMWALMTYTALLMLEVHQYADADATLHSLAKQFLGDKGKWLASFAMLFLFYSLCAAYIAGGGSQLNEKLAQWSSIQLPPAAGAVLFTLVFGLVVTLGTSKVDLINRGLFTLKVVFLILALTLLTPHVSSINLVEMPVEKGLMVAALPVIFTSFGFHGSIPSIVRYVGIDLPSLRKVMIIGSTLPLALYIFWQVASLGSVAQSILLQNGELSQFVKVIQAVVQQDYIASSISLFADLALATSFLGVSLGLFDFISDSFKRQDTVGGRLQTAAITYLPPLVFALFYPQGFITALGYAAIALVILAVVLPVLMVRKARQTVSTDNHYQVIGGNLGLSLAMVGGIAVVVAQFMA
ncbi:MULTISPECIES: tyrosine transporter TyrP [Salinivibrio]|jgi:tyrosine-specific transport protein|uniref:Aromatic amino acid permease n=2 Tax=Salinivibrio TaxID=51366 RepID=A0ABY7LEQ8_9GAMM|nr:MULTISPECIES: tyrosine transporter TyrP [Salinivibrio]ODQ00001.1 tyrosine transporter TyrP [Salinivibrio sp. DV]OOF20310.1 tyrosine transporter TyrP [Salinivibrio sp. IB574]OOF29013.1 tyrosine transporter TyrP [Salinivibrio sp. IB872]PCE66911.1 tyrosine transporter TyrP [Salinivibrio sp. YCSC6]QCF36191.1 tyrosine transporter TyrP [Salinivibrio sp. YCSC6]